MISFDRQGIKFILSLHEHLSQYLHTCPFTVGLPKIPHNGNKSPQGADR